jgi:PmbA protein
MDDRAATDFPTAAALASLVERALAEAARCGASAAETAVSCGRGLSVSVRKAEVETLEHHRSRSLSVTVYVGGRQGSARTSAWDEGALSDTVAAAVAIARHTQDDPCAGLADPQRLAREIPDLQLDWPWDLSAEMAIELASRCEAAAFAAGPEVHNSEGAGVASLRSLACYGNSHGFRGAWSSTRHSLSCAVVADRNGSMQRGGWASVAREAGDLEGVEAVGRRAGERAMARLGARRLATAQVPVLFAPEVARSLLGHLVAAASGGSLYRGASFLRGRLGERLFPGWVRIHEQPHLPRALGSAPFDGEGVATSARDLVSGGELKGYVLDSYSARRLGMATSGNAGGVHNLEVDPSAGDQTALLRQMGRGLLVTQLMGQGVNLVTGDYSRGASGFWVEHGEIAYPVDEITIASRLPDMFLGVLAAGNDVDLRGNIRCGSLLVEEMTVAGD